MFPSNFVLKMLKTTSSRAVLRKIWKTYATAAQVKVHVQPTSETFRTYEASPLNHTACNVGQFYQMPQEVKEQLFSHGGFPRSFETQIKTFAETCLMVREPAIDIIACLNSLDLSRPLVKFVLYGKKGNGKSLTLAHILHYGYDGGFLLVHVPWVGLWTRRTKDSTSSTTREGFVDLNLDAAAWLIHFKKQNAHLLDNPELRISREYVWSKREVSPKDAPISTIIELGINRVKYASDCVGVLAEEIKQLCRNGKCKALITVDGYNAFFYPKTRIYSEKREMVQPAKVTLIDAFINLSRADFNNAVCVVTVDEIAAATEDQKSHLPRYLLGKRGFENLDPFVPICVPEYTPKELQSCLDYYRDRRWVPSVLELDEQLAFISGSNPYKLMQICAPL